MAHTDMKIILNGQLVPLPEGFEDYIDPQRAVIVELDMHGGHLDPEPDCPAPSPRGRELVGPVNEFNRACRALGVPVVHVVNTYRTGDFEGRQSAWRRITEGHYSMLSRSCSPAPSTTATWAWRGPNGVPCWWRTPRRTS